MKHMPPHSLLTVQLPIILALTMQMVGCASVASRQADTTPEIAPSPVAILKSDTAKQSEVTDERFKFYKGSGELVKNPQSIANEVPLMKQSGGDITLNFEGADLREVVRTVLGEILKENYIVDPRVGGSITLRTTKPIPRSAAMHTLEEVLRMNGAVIVREADGVFRILPITAAGKGNISPRLGGPGKMLPPGFSLQVVPLQYMGVADIAKILEPLVGESASVRIDPLRNLLILGGTQLQLQHMMDTVEMFDVDWISGMSVGLVTLEHVDVKLISGEMEKLFGDKNLGPLAGALRVVPIERLNALLIVSPQAKYLEQARTWIERLDRGTQDAGQKLYVYPVQNGKAEYLADLISSVFSGTAATQQKSAASSIAPGLRPAEVKTADATQKSTTSAASRTLSLGGGVKNGIEVEGVSAKNIRVIADQDNNVLLILASPADYANIEAAIKKIDVVPRQVLIEVTIAEITLKDELKYGLEWFFNNGARINGQLDVGKAGVAPLVPGFSYSWVGKAGDVTAVLNALATDSKLKVISSPHITVVDNQSAKIQVGNKVPTISQTQTVATTSTTSPGIISTVQYLETGVLLAVKPRINSGGLITMEINQEVSNAIATTTSGIDSPTIQKRAAESTVTVQSGETLVMAGLISEENSRAAEGLPLLSRMPLLGGLFGTESSADNRTELIILITPRVLHNSVDAGEVTDEFRQRLSGLEKLMKSAGLDVGTSHKPTDQTKQKPMVIKLDKRLRDAAPMNSN